MRSTRGPGEPAGLPGDPAADPATWTLPRLRIDADGGWLHEDAEVTHPGILASLRASLRVDDEGYHLRVGPARIPVTVDDAPYAVVQLQPAPGGFGLVLSDGTREALALETLILGPGEVPYCRVKGGRFPARLSRAAAWTLLQHAEDTGAETLVLRLPGGGQHPVPRGPRPVPAAAG
jgi:hypothetical protein